MLTRFHRDKCVLSFLPKVFKYVLKLPNILSRCSFKSQDCFQKAKNLANFNYLLVVTVKRCKHITNEIKEIQSLYLQWGELSKE